MDHLEHSPLGGSGAHRFINCAGSFLLQREQIEDGTFEDVPSEFAERGTGAHELAAVCVATDTEPFELIGEEFNGFLAGWPGGISLDAVQVYVNECRRIMELCDYDGLAVVEKTYTAPALHPLLKGTVDFGYVSPSRGIFVRDYKNGEGIGVTALENRQLLYYAFLFLVQDPRLAEYRDIPVSLGIVQPNFYGVYEEPDVWETTVGYVLDFGYNVLLPRMHELMASRDIDLHDFVPGSHCQFCPVLLDCPKMQAAYKAFAEASEDFVTMLTNEELDAYYQQREYAKRFMTALDNTIYARLSTGGKIPSAKLVEKRVNRVWKPGAAAALKAAFGEEAYTKPEVKSPAQIEKLSSRGKEMATEWGYKPDSYGFTVAPLSDPRPEAKGRTNADVFAGHAEVDKPVDFGQF